MWISLIYTIVVSLLIRIVEGLTRQPPCCTGAFPRINNNNWHKGLQEAVYHSLTQHSAFDGSLDDRVERDRRLWKRINGAEFSPELTTVNNIQTGMLINADHFLEFQPSSYNCVERECRKTIMALWEIHRTDDRKGFYISVKLPVSHSYIENSYEYTSHDGLKHLGAENKHKQYLYHFTIGSDGKQNAKTDQRRIYKPIKFPIWSKNKNDYEPKKKDFNNFSNEKNEGNNNSNISSDEEAEDGDKIIKIIPRRRFQYRDSLKPKKQGLVLAYVPQNSQKEFQIPDQKYDGFLPIIQDPLQKADNRDIYRLTTSEKEYDIRHLKLYEDIVKKYIDAERNKPKSPVDFHPSKPYIQYSEPDPLYIQPSFTPPIEQKPNVDQNKFLIIHKYPDSINSQLPGGNIVGATPTVPYISVTVSNKIPVQNINQIDFSTLSTPKTTLQSTAPSNLSSTSTQTVNTTNRDVELITININNDGTLVTTTKQPPKPVTTTPKITETSREELTTVQPTIIPLTNLTTNALDESNEDSKLVISTQNRNLIKKDTTSRNNNVGNINSNENTTQPDSNTTETTTMTITTVTMNEITVTTTPLQITVQQQNLTDDAVSIDNETISEIQSSSEQLSKFTTTKEPKSNVNLTQNLEISTLTPVIPNYSNMTNNTNFDTGSFETDENYNVTNKTEFITTTDLNEQLIETTTANYYFEDARSQLADLFASLTFDLFHSHPQSPYLPESGDEETLNYSALLSSPNSSETIDSTNYDFLDEEITETSDHNPQHYIHLRRSPNETNGSKENTSRLLPSRWYSNSH